MSGLVRSLFRLAGLDARTLDPLGVRSLDAMHARAAATLAAVDAAVAEAAAAERRLAPDAVQRGAAAETALSEAQRDLRAARLALESRAGALRMRLALFRTAKLAVGARFVGGASATNAGDSVEALGRDLEAVAAEATRLREAAASTGAGGAGDAAP